MRNQSQFTTPLVVTPMPDGRRWKIHEEFDYETDAGTVIKIAAGETTDFASIPRFLWPILSPTGKYTRAAVVHDALYARHRAGIMHYSRAYADAVLLEAMRDCGCGWWTCSIIWLGVRLGGWVSWRTKKQGGTA